MLVPIRAQAAYAYTDPYTGIGTNTGIGRFFNPYTRTGRYLHTNTGIGTVAKSVYVRVLVFPTNSNTGIGSLSCET
jgi:hypothetical protein